MHRGVPTDAIYECVVFSLSMLYKKSNDIVRKFLRPISHNRVSVKNIPDKATLAVINKLFDASKSTDELFSMQIHSLLFELFYTLYKGGAVTKDKNKHKNEKQLSVLTGLMDWIDSNLTESITLTQLSQISGMNEKYLCRFFKEYTGKTPIDYVNYLRIEAACQELDETDLSVSQSI